MKIIYHCFGGSHSSVLAAGIHLELLPSNRVPSAREILDLAYFDTQQSFQHGQFQFMGKDKFGNEIYTIGRQSLGDIFEPMLTGLAEILQIPSSEFLLVNTLPAVNFPMKLGGFLSRALKVIWIGRPLVLLGVQHSYFKFVNLVNSVKEDIQDKDAAGELSFFSPGDARA